MLESESFTAFPPDGMGPDLWCRTSGARLRAKVWQDDAPGLPILFLNGVGCNLELVAGLAAEFPERRFISIELPGSGLTQETALPLAPMMLARMIVEAAQLLRAPRFDLIGLSLGGALAQQIALQYRSRVARLVLAGTCTGATMMPHDWSEDGLFLNANPLAAVISDLIFDLNGPHLRHFMQPSTSAVASQFASFTGWSSLPFLPLIQAPSLVLAGARDRIIPPSNAVQLSAFLARAEHHILPDAAHPFPYAEPERTASHIARFFEAVPAPTIN